MRTHIDLKRSPIETLGQFATWLTRPTKDRFAYWRTLFAGKRCALVLITYGKPGDPQRPAHEPIRRTSDREVHVIRRHAEAQEGSDG